MKLKLFAMCAIVMGRNTSLIFLRKGVVLDYIVVGVKLIAFNSFDRTCK
jgi:hypothetical protein